MGDSIYWIWLQKILGFANRNTEQVLEFFKDPEKLYKASANQRKECLFLSRAQRDKAADSATMDEAEKIYERCRECGIRIITPEDELYPQRLYDICDFPVVLYYKGEMPDIDDNVVLTLVGTRKATPDGRMIAAALSQSLTQCGAIVMSGGARGIDDAAHQGALRVGGVTLSLLGCGLEADYNPGCEETRKRILDNGGALISEFPPDYTPSKITFPIRNRLLSAMSLGVIVGEAPAKSGSLITARHALDMGRDMFAIPGSVMSELSEAANMMIRDGAKSVSCAFDVLEEYSSRYPHRLVMRKSQTPISQIVKTAPEYIDIQMPDEGVYLRDRDTKRAIDSINAIKGIQVALNPDASKTARRVYGELAERSLSLQELCDRLSLSAQQLLIAITELEINNIIASDSQRRYFIRKQ